MKRLSYIMFFIFSFGFAQNHTLTVSITALKNNNGKITAELYNTKEKFLKKGWKTVSGTIKNNSGMILFSDLPTSDYAIMVYHDENNNGKLDKNFIGLPKEPVACSNNAKGFMGPPKYNDAQFSLTSNTKITIKMNAAM